MTPAAVSPDPFFALNDECSSIALLRSIRESARITMAWWKGADIVELSDIEGTGSVIVDPACGLTTVMPDFGTYQKMWGHVVSPLEFQWEDYNLTRFGSFMYLQYAVETLEDQRDFYRGDEITKGSMVFVFFNEFIEKLKRFRDLESTEVENISSLLNDVGLG